MAERIRSEVAGVLRSAKMLTHYGLNSKKGFILAGDPGNGKTLLLKILANTVDATCIIVPFTKSCDEKDMAAVFRLARYLAPTILILEDIDLYGEHRDRSKDSEYLGELMNELDGMVDNKEIIVFATTNHLAKVEKALQNRPGRFDRIYKILNPDLNARRLLLEHFVNKVPNKVSKEQVEILAENFSGYSGAYLKELVNSGFAQAVLRNEQEPVLEFSDLSSNLEVLKNDEKRQLIGFEAVRQVSQLEGTRAVRGGV
jgi:SpoVK/Ycf46/Vps4 family AAA+-type ATPase